MESSELSTNRIDDLLAFVRLYLNAGYTVSASKAKKTDLLANACVGSEKSFVYLAVATKEE